MSTVTMPRSCPQTQDDYVTDWRAVAGIIGIVLVFLVAAGVARSAKLHSSPTLESRATVNVPVVTKDSVAAAAHSEQTLPPITVPFLVVTPWMSSDSSSAAVALPEDVIEAEVSIETRPVQPLVDEIATSKPVGAVKKTIPPFIGQIEDELSAALDQHSVEISIDQVKETREKLVPPRRRTGATSNGNEQRSGDGLFFALIDERPDLEGLPMRKGSECRLPKQSLHFLTEISQALRPSGGRFASASRGVSEGFDDGPERELYFEMSCVEHLRNPRWHHPEAVSTWVQIIQASSHLARLELVSALAAIDGPEASAVLVDRTMFDLSASVRTAASEVLETRELGIDEQQRLLRGFRYPWAPIAEHAADAIVALQLTKMLPQLTAIVDEPDPNAPFLDDDGKWRRTELVRVNHLRNCLLCHAVSATRDDPVRALVPTPGQPLPVVYYQSQDGDFIRADVTYLKQDFSLMKLVPNAHPWPAKQRFDYFLRTRGLTPSEQAEVVSQAKESDNVPLRSYPQRDAALRAIRGLSS